MEMNDRKFYIKVIQTCLLTILIVLGTFGIYYATQYPKIKKQDYDRYLAEMQKWVENGRGFPDGVDLDYADKTLKRMRELFRNGKIEYHDFSKMRILNNFPKQRYLTTRECMEMLRALNKIMDLKEAGKLDQWDELMSNKDTIEMATSSQNEEN